MDVHQLHVQKLPSAHIVRLQKVIRLCTAQCKMLLFHAKTTMRESCNFWRNEEKEETDFISAVWWLSGMHVWQARGCLECVCVCVCTFVGCLHTCGMCVNGCEWVVFTIMCTYSYIHNYKLTSALNHYWNWRSTLRYVATDESTNEDNKYARVEFNTWIRK